VSSILEALRELEGRRPPASPSVVTPAEPPPAVNRAMETLGIVTVGLVLGALGFVLWLRMSSLLPATPAREDPAPPSVNEKSAPARPAWLETADPPRARVEGQARATAERPAREGDAPAPGAVAVAAIDYAPEAARRTVTLRLGRAPGIRLHEHESAGGYEVQLIEPEAVYVRHGPSVFMLEPEH
jgi:hypothetical protein